MSHVWLLKMTGAVGFGVGWVQFGNDSGNSRLEEVRAMQERISGSRIEVISQAGHLANLERPAAFNHVLTEFLVSLTAS